MAKLKQSRRSLYLEIIKRNVELFVEADEIGALFRVMESTGYLNNWSQTTSRRLGDAILALAAVIPIQHVRDVAGSTEFQRIYAQVGHTYKGTDHHRPWYLAQAASDAVTGLRNVELSA